jgi:hypothetical protein
LDLNGRRAVAIAGVAVDLDGLAIVFGREAFNTYHHVVFHNLLSAGVITLAAFLLFPRNLKLVLFCALAAIIHFGLDFLGCHWDLYFLRPFSSAAVNLSNYLPEWLVMYVFQGAGTVIMFGFVVRVFLKKERSFLEIFTPKGDRFIMNFVTLPWRHRCGECGRRAFYQCGECGGYFCSLHRKVISGWQPLCQVCYDKARVNTGIRSESAAGEDS